MCGNYGVKTKQNNAHNPQSNSVLERTHQVLGNMFRTFELADRDLAMTDPWDAVFASAAFAIRATYHTTLGVSLAQLIFGRDMILPIQYCADWAMITQHKQKHIDDSNARENQNRLNHVYKEGDLILLDKPGFLPKLETPRTGPYKITKVHSDGTFTFQDGPYCSHNENIRRATPYFERS